MSYKKAAPREQNMTNDDGTLLKEIMNDTSGIVMRQKLDILEVFCPQYQKENKYKVGQTDPDAGDEPEEWNDEKMGEMLDKRPLFTLKEKSECCDRICCMHARRFQMTVKADERVVSSGDSVQIAWFDRPFKCSIPCGVFMLWPQEISSLNMNDEVLGRTVHDFRCTDGCTLKQHWRVEDGKGETKYFIRSDQCCNANCCAPSPCCKQRVFEILSPDQNDEMGRLINYFPGCNIKSCVGTADNYRIEFPKDASPEMKLQLMASGVLIDFMLFEKQPEQPNNGGGGEGF